MIGKLEGIKRQQRGRHYLLFEARHLWQSSQILTITATSNTNIAHFASPTRPSHRYLISYEVQPTRHATFSEQLDDRSRADLILIDPVYHGRSEAAGARAHLRGKLSQCMCQSFGSFHFTFCWFVAVPSVPVRQSSTWSLFPKDRNSLKQALALMTDLQESLLTSQGRSDRADEMKTRRRLV